MCSRDSPDVHYMHRLRFKVSSEELSPFSRLNNLLLASEDQTFTLSNNKKKISGGGFKYFKSCSCFYCIS